MKTPLGNMAEGGVGMARAAAVAGPVIAALVTALFAAAYILSSLAGLPPSLDLAAPVRYVGGALVVAGLAVIAWTFSQRSPSTMIVSTYVTFVKALRRTPLTKRAGRTEPLVVAGPQKYTRNPLYFGVVVMVFGWALVGGNSFVFVATGALLLWFILVLIPYEERELKALFGDEWVRYSLETPMLVPLTKRKKR